MDNAPKKQYKCLVFDADHTLLDFAADERAAFRALYEELGVEVTEELLDYSRHHSEEEWTKAGLRNVHDESMQKTYHQVYRSHIKDLFDVVFAKYPPKTPLDTQKVGEKFLVYLEKVGKPFPDAEKTLAALSKKTGGRYLVCIATNGLVSIQTGRLKELKKYAHGIYISEDVGAIKPLPAFFERLFKEMRVTAKECLMIGDSLVSDVAGADAVGMDGCWYNPHGFENTTPHKPEFEISSLSQLVDIL